LHVADGLVERSLVDLCRQRSPQMTELTPSSDACDLTGTENGCEFSESIRELRLPNVENGPVPFVLAEVEYTEPDPVRQDHERDIDPWMGGVALRLANMELVEQILVRTSSR
jgi:hypothetical protein